MCYEMRSESLQKIVLECTLDGLTLLDAAAMAHRSPSEASNAAPLPLRQQATLCRDANVNRVHGIDPSRSVRRCAIPRSFFGPRQTNESNIHGETRRSGLGATKSSTTRCLYCRQKLPIEGRRHRKFCKASCRTLAYRARKRDAPQVDAAALPSTALPSASPQPRETETGEPLPVDGAAPTTAPQANSSSAIVEIVTDLNRQHEESSAALQRLLDLVRSAQQRKALLRRELAQAQEALRTRASDLERLQAEVVALREQTTKREQAEKTEEVVRQRLLQVEHYIAALTTEQQRRDATEQVHLDDQARAHESLRGELASSLSKVCELETTMQPLRDKQAELTQHLEDTRNG